MSAVTLSNPHCAITSAENPDGIASQAFTTALPEAQTFLTLFAISRVSLFYRLLSSVDFLERPDRLAHSPLYARLAHADFAGGVDYRRPGIIRQGHAVFGALRTHLCFRLARDQYGIGTGGRLGVLEVGDVARNLAIEEITGIDPLGVDIKNENAGGEAAVRPGGAGAGQRAAEQLADERQTRALVLAEGADRALALAMVARTLRTVRSIKYRRIFAQIAVEIDQRAFRQLLAAAARAPHLAFGDNRGRETQHDRPLPIARNADAIGRRRQPPLDATIGRHQHRACGIDEVNRHQSFGCGHFPPTPAAPQ